ncbi:MAG: hypothetical protein R3Y38_00930 [Rikenellaceae bacterium]
MNSEFLEYLPFIIIAALAIFGRKAKVQKPMQEQDFEQTGFEIFDFVETKQEITPKVFNKVEEHKKLEIKELDKKEEVVESILPEEINWQRAVIYSELLKPKFKE